jgi:hypothetical protein
LQNVSFNENKEPKEVFSEVNLPGLRSEGEPMDAADVHTTQDMPITPQDKFSKPQMPKQLNKLPQLPPQQSTQAQNNIDYRKYGNPDAQKPSTWLQLPTPSTPPDVARPTESLRAKLVPSKQTNTAQETLTEDEFNKPECAFATCKPDLPCTPTEALAG